MKLVTINEVIIDQGKLDPKYDNLVCQQFLDFAGVIIIALNPKGEIMY